MGSSASYQAGGNISPSRFVMAQLGTGQFQVIQATTAQPLFGISQMGTFYAPGTAADNTYAAVSGQYLGVYRDEEHDDILLYLGGTVTGGQMLKSDANGFGVAADFTLSVIQYIGAEARESGVSGQLIRVIPRLDIVGRPT